MQQYDKDESGQIEFSEFLLMFRDQLLDLKEVTLTRRREASGNLILCTHTMQVRDYKPKGATPAAPHVLDTPEGDHLAP